MFVLTLPTLLDIADLDVGVGGPFNAAKIALYTSDTMPTREKVIADFDIADFGGLTNLKAITWGVPFVNDNNQAEVIGGVSTWLTTALTGLPVTVYGYVMTNTAGTALILAERFATPIVFARNGQSESLVPRLVWDT